LKLEENKVYLGDWVEGSKAIPDKSVNLLIADPPYFEVKGEFDFVWKSFDDYLKDVECWAKECKRLLADNGTLFWYGSAKRIAYAQIIFDKHFKLINSLVWENTNPHKQQGRYSEGLRSFAPLTERILMYSNEVDQTGLEQIKLDVNNFKPLRDYFQGLHSFVAVSKRVLIDVIGQRVDHCFRYNSTQWDLPTIETYNQLIETFKINQWNGFKEYETLRKEYETLRRPFDNFMNFGDVIKMPNFETGSYAHDTVKPEKLTRALILTCSRKDDLVFVPFAGSGTECAMAAKEKRRFIGFDIEDKYCQMANNRAKKYLENRQTSILDFVD